MSWYAPREAPKEELLADYRQAAVDASQYICNMILAHPELNYSFGNPIFENNGQYTQDKVLVLGDALRNCTLREGEDLIDNYIDLILLHWQYGLSERVFNFTANNGVDGQGRVILLDFGEITHNKEKISSRIAAERWLKSWSYKGDLPEQFKRYYQLRMKERLSNEVFEATWRTAL